VGKTRRAWINALFLVVTLVINTLGAIGIINGLTQKQISDMYVTLITPSPATFSIWSVIYLLLIISVIVMIVNKKDPYYQSAADQISVLFWISCILNIAWIVSFSFLLVELSVFFILAFAISLALICMKLAQIQEGKRWLLPLTFGLYTGWLTIATVVNIAAALVKLKWDGFGIAEETWATIILVVAVLLALVILLKTRNAAYPLPIAWAYFGIFQFLKAPEGFRGEFGLLQTVALAGMAVLVILAAIQLYRNRFSVLSKSVRK
jgi:hypothetical protein